MDDPFAALGDPALNAQPGMDYFSPQTNTYDFSAGTVAPQSLLLRQPGDPDTSEMHDESLFPELDAIEAEFFASVSKTQSASPPIAVQEETLGERFTNFFSFRRKRNRYPVATIETLESWFVSHLDYPYPSPLERKELCAATGLSDRQLRTWFTNARARGPPQTRKLLQHGNASGGLIARGNCELTTATNANCVDASHNQHTPKLTSASLEGLNESASASALSVERYVDTMETFDSAAMNAIKQAAATLPSRQGRKSENSSANSMWSGRAASAISSRAGSHRTAASHGSRTSASSIAVSVMSRTSGIQKPGRKGRRRYAKSSGSIAPAGDANHVRRVNRQGTTAPPIVQNGLRRRNSGVSIWSLEQPLPPPMEQDVVTIETRSPYACTVCTKESRDRSDWKRHEATHYPELEKWTCMPEPAHWNSGGCLLCGRVLGSLSCLAGGWCDEHPNWDCMGKPPFERTFARKDHLKQHLYHAHGVSKERLKDRQLNTDLDQCYQETPWADINLAALWCGFCKTFLPDWTQRSVHIADHFQAGLNLLAAWRDAGWECENFCDNIGLSVDGLTRICSSLGCSAEKAYSDGCGPGQHLANVHSFGSCGGVIFRDGLKFREHLKEVHQVEFAGMNDFLCETALFVE